MNEKFLKTTSATCYILGILCAFLIYTSKTYGYAFEIRILFYVFGALGLLLSLLQFKIGNPDNNLLFWLGSLAVYLGFVAKTVRSEYASYLIVSGLGLTAISFFFDPFKRSSDDEDELLDQ